MAFVKAYMLNYVIAKYFCLFRESAHYGSARDSVQFTDREPFFLI